MPIAKFTSDIYPYKYHAQIKPDRTRLLNDSKLDSIVSELGVNHVNQKKTPNLNDLVKHGGNYLKSADYKKTKKQNTSRIPPSNIRGTFATL